VATTELVVELILSGFLLLVALLLPWIGWPPPDLKDGHLIAAIAAAFVIGVATDRCADSILSRWEGVTRVQLAHARPIRVDRATLVAARMVRDPLPEGWMRTFIMDQDKDGVLRWFDQLRVRVRITRTLALLSPALTTSAMLALALSTAAPGDSRRWLSLVHVVVLLATFACAELVTGCRSPKTHHFRKKAAVRRHARRLWLWSPATLWFGCQLALAACVLLCIAGNTRVWVACVLGFTITALAIVAWHRVVKTFIGFMWTYCYQQHRAALGRAVVGTRDEALGGGPG
jgi:hypothetical protein